MTQFENMHKQLTEESKVNSEPQPNSNDVTHGTNNKKPNLFSNVLDKRDKTNSMPVFAGSTTHNGVLTANNGKDMNFVMGLSENLLVECRRLQAENEKKTNRLNRLENEHQVLGEKHEKLESYHQITNKELTALKDTNWELEVKLQQFSVEFKELRDKLNRNKKELRAEQENSKAARAELEVFRLQRIGLEKELAKKENEYLIELKDLRKNVSELNDENDSLYNKIKTLNERALQSESLQTQLGESTRLVDVLKGNLKEIETKLENSCDSSILKARLSESEATASKLRLQLTDLETKDEKNTDMQHEPFYSTDIVNELRRQIAAFETTTNNHANENRALKSNTDVIKQEADNLKSKLTGLLQQLHKSDNNEKDLLRTELSNSNHLIEELRQQLTKKNTRNGSKRRKNSKGSKTNYMLSEKPILKGDDSDTLDQRATLKDLDNELSANEDFSIPVEEVEKYAKLHQMRLISEEEYSKSQLGKMTDSNEQLVSTIGDTNLLALPNDKSSEKRNIEGSPSIDTMIKKIESSGYKVLPFPEFNEKQEHLNEWERPSEEYLWSKANHLGKTMISQDSYDKLLNPSVSQLKETLENVGYTVMSNEEHKKLLSSIDAPELEYLETKLIARGRKTVTEEDFKKYTSPDISFVEDLSKSMGYIAIAQENYHEMQKQISDPSVETILRSLSTKDFQAVLSQFSKEHHLVLLNRKDHDQLVSSLANPSKQYLLEKCPNQQIQPVPIDEYQGMLQTLQNPTLEFMNEKATSMNKKLVSLKIYEELHRTSENPSVDFLRQHAKKNHLVMLSEDDHNAIKKALNEPDIEYLQTKAKNHKLVDFETYNKLTGVFNGPSLDFLSEKASEKGYDMVNVEEHKELLRKATSPSEDEISQFAKNIGAIVVPLEKYENLSEIANSPSKEFILEKSDKLNMVVMEDSDYKKLMKASTDKDSLFNSVRGFGFIPIPISELNILNNSTLEKSNMFDIEKRLKTLGYVAVSMKQYNDLNKSPVDRATMEDTLALCSKYSLKPISTEEYQKLQNDSKPTIYSEDELIEMLKSHGYAVIPVREHEALTKMIKSPTTEFLEEGAITHGKVLINRELHEQQIKMLDSPPIEFLSEKASTLRYRIFSEMEYEKLKSQIDSPSIDALKNKAKLYNMMLISCENHDRLMNAVNNPTISALQTKAAAIKKCIIDDEEYKELKRKASSPTKEELETFAATLNMTLVMKDGYNNLLKQIDYPSLEFLEKKLSHFQYVAIPINDHQALKKEIENPSEEFLSEKAGSRDMLLLNRADYERYLHDLENPSIEYLDKKAKNYSKILASISEIKTPEQTRLIEGITKEELVAVAKEELDNLKIDVENPSLDLMISNLEHSNYIVLESEKYEYLKKQIDSPYLETVAQQAKRHGHVLVRSKDLSERSDRDVEDLGPLTTEGAFLLLNAEEYDALLNSSIDKLGQRDLLQMCNKLGLVPVPKAEFEKLTNTPDVSRIQEYATELGLVVISQEDFDGMVSELEKPLEQCVHSFAEKHNLLLLDKNSYANLLTRLNNPTKAELEKYCEKFGLVLVSNEEYETFIEQNKRIVASSLQEGLHTAKGKTNPEVLHSTEAHARTVESPKDYEGTSSGDSITTFNKSDVYRAAKALNLTVLTTNEYENLLSLKSPVQSPTLKDLQEHALHYDMRLIPLGGEEYGNSALQMKMTTDSTNTDNMQVKPYSLPTTNSNSTGHSKATEDRSADLTGAQKVENIEEKHNNNEFIGQSLEHAETMMAYPSSILKPAGTTLVSNTEPLNIDTLREKIAQEGYMLVPTPGHNPIPKKAENTENEDIEDWYDADNFEGEPKNEIAVLEKKAKSLGLTLMTNSNYEKIPDYKGEQVSFETVSSQAAFLGLVVLEEKTLQTLELKAKDSKERLKQMAEEFGYHVLQEEEYSLLHKQLQEAELDTNNIQAKAKELGYYALNEEQYEDLKDAAIAGKKELTFEEFKEKATELNLVTLSVSNYEELASMYASNSSKFNEEDLKKNAFALGLTIISNDAYKDLISKRIPKRMTKEDLAMDAQKLGLKLVDGKSGWTRNDLVQASEKLGLITLDKKEFAKLQRLSKPESLKERAQAANMICLPKSAVVASSDKTNSDDMIVIPMAYYKKLLSRESSKISARKQQVEMSKPSVRPSQRLARQESVKSTQSGRPVQKVREQRSVNSLKGSTRNTVGVRSDIGAGTTPATTASNTSHSSPREAPIPRTNSMSVLSISTIESLDEPSIIPALTQTVIGEYLYKYYQPFGVGGESRHERYFWVHPYSMTLYWSPTNPVLENPTNHSAKCAPIVKVDSVINTNPTQGIYHKCLVITTDTRVIKIACPTRQRHNVWYNSLRYLLQRSMDGISLEDIAENPNDTMYSGKIFALSKQPSKKLSRAGSSAFLRGKH